MFIHSFCVCSYFVIWVRKKKKTPKTNRLMKHQIWETKFQTLVSVEKLEVCWICVFFRWKCNECVISGNEFVVVINYFIINDFIVFFSRFCWFVVLILWHIVHSSAWDRRKTYSNNTTWPSVILMHWHENANLAQLQHFGNF